MRDAILLNTQKEDLGTRRFWVLYLLMLSVIFGTFAGGLYYVDTHAGFDILTSGGSQTITAFIIYSGSNYTIFENGESAPFTTGLNLGLQAGTCYSLTFTESIFPKGGSIEIAPTDSWNCGIGYPPYAPQQSP